MKIKTFLIPTLLLGAIFFFSFNSNSEKAILPSQCVFNNLFGVVPLDSNFKYSPPAEVLSSVNNGLAWLQKAQLPDGGWGAGFHHNQKEMNPRSVPADPATTAMVSMALLRTGTTLEKGEYQKSLKAATEFLLQAVENAKSNDSKITALTGTQIQRKLGQNIDLVLTTQYFSNLLDELNDAHPLYNRVFKATNKSVKMLQATQDASGKTKGAGWAGVLQSAYASNALEAAETQGAKVDNLKLNQSKAYQRNNYDPIAAKVETRDGAGIALYAVSGSVRTSARDARKAKEYLAEAKDKGELPVSADVTYDNLVKSGVEENEALTLDAAFKVYESAKIKAQEREVMSGFGNNGGEEFMSFLQTGESLIINKDLSWKKWFDAISANLLKIQNKDGSWNGHHCITSPVYCTATCILTLSVNNDIEELVARGE